MVALVSPSDPFVEWPTGVPQPMDISWYYYTSGHVLQNMEAVDWTKLHLHTPLETMDEAMGKVLPAWRGLFEHTRLDDWWEPLRYQNKFDRVKVPVLHISGWYDDEQVGTPLNFIGMTTHGAPEVRGNQKLLMGWWPHNTFITGTKLGEVDFGAGGQMDREGYILRWLDYWLKGQDTGIMKEPAAKLFLMGANRWVDEQQWPMARTQWTKFYLHSGGRANSFYGDGGLSTEAPASEPQDRYTSDPAQPGRSSQSRRLHRSAVRTIIGRWSGATMCWCTRARRSRKRRKCAGRSAWNYTRLPRPLTQISWRSWWMCGRTASRSGLATGWCGRGSAMGWCGRGSAMGWTGRR